MSETADTGTSTETGATSSEVTSVEQMREAETGEQANEVAQETPEVAQPEQTPAQKLVPLAALHEERARVKELRHKQDLMEERFQQFAQAVQQRLNPPAPAPEKAEDPIGYFDHRTQQLEQMIQPVQQRLDQMTQAQQQQHYAQQLYQHATQQEAQFVQQAPDYHDAVKYMQQTSLQGLKALGYDDAQAQQLVHQEYWKLADRLAREGQSVPEYIYNHAKANGYKPQAKVNLESAQKGVKQAKSLGSGASSSNNLTLEALSQMNRTEFEEAVKDEKTWRKLMGG